MFNNIREDIKVYFKDQRFRGPLKKFLYLIFTQELHAVLVYRFGHWVTHRCHVPVLRQLLYLIYFALSKWSIMIIGIDIWPSAKIGPGLKIEHCGGVIVTGRLGSGCRVSQGVTIGHLGGFRGGGSPTLGDNVYVGAGAKILGDISVGDNVKIGANAVVIADVPPGSTAVGVPARIVKRRGCS